VKQNTAKISYIFKNLPGSLRKVLICPECGEMLLQEDIEHYGSCPYCGNSFAITNDLEEFLLNPFVDQWSFIHNPVLPDSITKNAGERLL
jgi:hypothetical protein